MKTNKISPKVLILLQFLILSFGLYLVGNFLPVLSLDAGIDSIQALTIRFLLTYTYSVDITSRMGIFLLLIITTICNSMILLWNHIQKNSAYFRTWYVILALFHYFAWVFVQRYSPNYAAQIRSLYFEEIIFRGIIYVSILIGSLIIQKYLNFRKTKHIATSSSNVPVIEFICPHCQAKYSSNVQYCVQCHQMI